MFGEKLIAQLGLDYSEFETKIGGASKLTSAFDGVLGKVGLGLGAGAVIAFFDSVISRGGELQDLSEQLGVTTDSLQSLDFMTKQAGVSTEALHMVYGKLTVAGAEAADKTTSSAKALAALAISSKDFNDASPDRKLEMVAKASAAAEDKQAAFAAVSDLLGAKIAPRLTSVLKELAEKGLDGVTKSAKEAGQVMSKETIRRLDELGDSASALKDKVKVMGSTVIGVALAIGEAIGTIFNGKMGENLGKLMALDQNTAEGIATDFESVFERSARAADKLDVAVQSVWVAMQGTEAKADDLKKLDEARAKLKERELSDNDKINMWLDKVLTLESEKARWVRESKEWTELETESLGLQTKVAETRAAVAKKAADETKKINEENAKAREDESKMEARSRDFWLEELSATEKRKEYLRQEAALKVTIDSLYEHSVERTQAENDLLDVQKKLRDTNKEIARDQGELAKLLLIPEMERTEVQKEQIKLLTGQTTKARELAEIASLTAKLTDGSITPAEKERLAVMLGQERSAAATNKALGDQLVNLGKIAVFGKSYDAQSTESLEYVKNNLAKQLDDQRRGAGRGAFNFGSEFDPITGEARFGGGATIAYQLAQVSKELEARQKFQSYLNMGGESLAKRIYSPQEFERLSATIKPPDESKRIADTLTSIEDRLKPIFSK